MAKATDSLTVRGALRGLFCGLAAAGVMTGALAAQSYYGAGAGENGYGPDPDRDGNPATNTGSILRIGDAAEAAFDPPYQVITFESGRHGEAIAGQYQKPFGVSFSEGVTRQICEGQRYFRYDSQCTYRRAPSGRFAALYQDEWRRPLEISFAQPVCVAALAVYPTGGREGERYRVTLQPYDAAGEPLPRARVNFTWTEDTFRWRLMAGAYLLRERASRVDVSVRSLDHRRKNVRFLIDDVAFVETGCAQALADLEAAAAAANPPPPPPDWLVDRRERREQRKLERELEEEGFLSGSE